MTRNQKIRKLLKNAAKYKTCLEWCKSDNGKSVSAAQYYGVYKQCTAHMPGNMRWSKKQPDSTIMIAKRYRTRSEWKKGHNNSYRYALRRKKLFVLCVSHMPQNAGQPYKILDRTTGRTYDTVRRASLATRIPFQRIAEMAGGKVSNTYKNRFVYIANWI